MPSNVFGASPVEVSVGDPRRKVFCCIEFTEYIVELDIVPRAAPNQHEISYEGVAYARAGSYCALAKCKQRGDTCDKMVKSVNRNALYLNPHRSKGKRMSGWIRVSCEKGCCSQQQLGKISRGESTKIDLAGVVEGKMTSIKELVGDAITRWYGCNESSVPNPVPECRGLY